MGVVKLNTLFSWYSYESFVTNWLALLDLSYKKIPAERKFSIQYPILQQRRNSKSYDWKIFYCYCFSKIILLSNKKNGLVYDLEKKDNAFPFTTPNKMGNI